MYLVVFSGLHAAPIIPQVVHLLPILNELALTPSRPPVMVGCMAPALSLVGTDAATAPPLNAARDAWLAHMKARAKKPASINQFRTVFDKAARDQGWKTPADFTFASVTAWLAKSTDEGKWSPATVRRNLAVFKGFSRYAAAAEILPRDVLALAVGPDGDGGAGARAATLTEARAIIRHAALREEADRRARSARSLYWLLLFGAGMRFTEPKGLLWSDVHLDNDPPFILWRPDQHKNRKRMEVAISAEVAWALRNRNGNKIGLVFDSCPPPAAFRKDRDLCMIPAADRRGRGFSPHSARKFFATTLTQMGVHARLIDVLMRHTSGVQGRYVDIPLSEQAHALKDFPRLLPEIGGLAVDARGQIAESMGAKHDHPTDTTTSRTSSLTGRASQHGCLQAPGVRDAGVSGFPASPSGDSASASGLKNQAENSGGRPDNGAVSTSDAIADMLESVARVLRSTRHGTDRPPTT